MSPVSTPSARGANALLTALVATPLAVALLYYGHAASELAALLGTASAGLTPGEAGVFAWAAIGTSLVLTVPAIVASVIAALLAPRTPTLVLGVLLGLALGASGLDLTLYRTFGRHLTGLVAYAALPHGAEAAGDTSRWWMLCATWLAVGLVLGVGSALGAAALVSRVERSLSQGMRRVVVSVGTLVFVVAAGAPLFTWRVWHSPRLADRLHGALIADLRVGVSVDGAVSSDPALAALASELGAAYAEYYPLLLAGQPADIEPIRIEQKPNVIVIMVESFRHDFLTAEYMPRLFEWARGGLRLTRHYAGTVYSEAGMFALLYGRSPLVYHPTLDQRTPPPFCELLHTAGYTCGYYSGHPKVWMRREEFVNATTFSEFHHDDRDGWPDWDRRALAALGRRARQAEPHFGLAFLMSSHFEYQYPPEYERHLPVARESKWHVTQLTALGEESRVPHLNRYKNAMAFLDDAIADVVTQLDLSRSIVVVTGDHGESIYDDGRYGHGYGFADIVARVPMVIAGAGIPTGVRDDLTLHVDVLPTVLHAMAGQAPVGVHLHGRSLLEPGRRESALLAYVGPNRIVGDALLLSGAGRLRLELHQEKPKLRVQGFEDALGRDVAAPSFDAPALRSLLQSELDRARR